MRKLFALLLAFTVDLKKTAAAINAEIEEQERKKEEWESKVLRR